jgi:hypothetical protein
MPSSRHVSVAATGLLAIALLAGVGVSGCAQPSSRPSPSPTPSASVRPVFSSDAQALKAAKKTYAGYTAASDAVGHDGGKDPERIAPWVTKKWFEYEKSTYVDFQKSGETIVGTATNTKFEIQQSNQSSDRATVSVYVCVDVSSTRIVDKSGADVTSPTRPPVLPLLVKFVSAASGSRTLLVERSGSWSGENFC